MRIGDCMTSSVLTLQEGESAALAARLLSRGNVGALPVLAPDGRVSGIVTDRDLVIRCLAAGRNPAETPVSRLMTPGAVTAEADAETGDVLALMARQQVRRVPITENGKLVGIVSLGDLARRKIPGAAQALECVSSGISRR